MIIPGRLAQPYEVYAELRKLFPGLPEICCGLDIRLRAGKVPIIAVMTHPETPLGKVGIRRYELKPMEDAK